MWKTDFSGIQGKDPALACRVETVDGVPRLFIGGKETAPFLFFGNSEAENWEPVLADEIRMAAGRGIHLHSLVLHLPYIAPGTDWRQAGFLPFSEGDGLLHCGRSRGAGVSPDLHAPSGGGLVAGAPSRSAGGVRDWQNGGAEHCERGVAEAGDGRTSGHAGVCAGASRLQPADCGVSHLSPVCRGMDEHERPLRRGGPQRGQPGDVQQLAERAVRHGRGASAAWGRRERLGQAAIPVPPNNVNFQEECRGLFLDVEKQRDVLDVYDYISDLTARRIEELSEVIKRGTNGKSLVMHFYGYLFELGDPKTGHQALRQVLNSPYVDVLCSPVGYLDRLAGGALSLMAPGGFGARSRQALDGGGRHQDPSGAAVQPRTTVIPSTTESKRRGTRR